MSIAKIKEELNRIRNPNFVPLDNNKIDNTFLFEQLFEYIRLKKPAFNEAFAKITSDDDQMRKAEALFTAIQDGDHGATIFDHPDCYLYLLFLIKENQLPFYQGMTAYLYIMTLMQFTARQKLKPEEEKKKDLRDISVRSLSINGVFTEKSEAILEGICERLLPGANLTSAELKAFVLTLPPTEQWLIKIPSGNTGYDKLMISIFNYSYSTPYFPTETETETEIESDKTKSSLLVPSISLISYILKKVSPQALEPQFGFGRISNKTLNKLHQANKHFVPLYAPLVKNNMTVAHDLECGPLSMVHDFIHLYYSALVSEAFRKKIYDVYIPFLREKLQRPATNANDTFVVNATDQMMWHLGDFDLLEVTGRINPTTKPPEEERQEKYLVSAFGKAAGDVAGVRGANVTSRDGIIDNIDGLYYLIECVRQSEKGIMSDEESALLDKAYQPFTVDKRPNGERISTTLSLLARKVISGADRTLLPPTDHPFSWQDWLEILNYSTDNNEIWNKLNKTLLDELLRLMNEYNLICLPPYLPLTEEIREQLVEWMTQSRRKCMDALLEAQTDPLIKAILKNESGSVLSMLTDQPELKYCQLTLPANCEVYFVRKKSNRSKEIFKKIDVLDFILRFSEIDLDTMINCFGDKWFQKIAPERLVYILKRFPPEQRLPFALSHKETDVNIYPAKTLVKVFPKKDRASFLLGSHNRFRCLEMRTTFQLLEKEDITRVVIEYFDRDDGPRSAFILGKITEVLPEQDRLAFVSTRHHFISDQKELEYVALLLPEDEKMIFLLHVLDNRPLENRFSLISNVYKMRFAIQRNPTFGEITTILDKLPTDNQLPFAINCAEMMPENENLPALIAKLSDTHSGKEFASPTR